MKYIILIVTIFFVNIIFCQESYKIVIVDSITNQPISNVRISSNSATLTTSDEKGIAYLPNSIKSVILIKDFYFDLEIIAGKSRTIKLKPILSINLDEILIKPYIGTSVFDKIYNVYKSKRNYNMNYKIQNVSIKFDVNNDPIIALNEIFYNGKVQKSAKIFTKVKNVQHDQAYYRSIGRNNISDNAVSNVVSVDDLTFEIPFFHPYYKRNFAYFDEINNFFSNTAKFKYTIEEDDENYLIMYSYKDIMTKFKFKISLVVNKNNYCIVNFKKNLINDKKNNFTVSLVNSKKSQKFTCEKFVEEVIFNINELGIAELVSESITVEYNIFENKSYNFKYQHVIEPSISFNYDERNLIEFNELIKNK